jgi:hypothetical protein
MAVLQILIRGHLIPLNKPAELPDVIVQQFIEEVNSRDEAVDRVQKHLREILDVGGMGCQLDGDHTGEGRKNRRVFVYKHLISYLEAEVKPLTGEMPQADPEVPGQWLDRSGNVVGLQ